MTTVPAGQELKIGKVIGGGGQGTVYEAATRTRAERAVKIFSHEFLRSDPGTPLRLRRLMEIGQPSAAFAWPQEAVVHKPSRSVGYVMLLVRSARPAHRFFVPEKDGLPLTGPPLEVRAKALFNVAAAMSALHLSGLIHKDLSGANVRIDPNTGNVTILDCDSCEAPGGRRILAMGTLGYQAYECVARQQPQTTLSDLHSLAVISFHLLTGTHPLLGRRRWPVRFPTPADLDRLFIHQALFMFDPHDEGNRPMSPADDPFGDCGASASLWWPTLPEYIRSLFVRAFTDALKHPSRRVPAAAWMGAAIRLGDSLAPCPKCSRSNSLDATVGAGRSCWSCGSPIMGVPHLLLGESRFALVPGRGIFPHHVGGRSFDRSRRLVVVDTKAGSGALGLKNSGSEPVVATAPTGETLSLQPGQAVLLTGLPHGTTLRIGRRVATVMRRLGG